jgi:hypothetical protein
MRLILSEEQYQRLILEADKRGVIMNSLGFNQAWADTFHRISDKVSVWIADAFLKEMLQEIPKLSEMDDAEHRAIVIRTINGQSPQNERTWLEMMPQFRYIMDWLRGSNGTVNLRNYNYRNALEAATEWHNSLRAEVQINFNETNEVFLDYRDSRGIGFYWANLGTRECSDEKARMGHCGRASHGILLSLREITPDGNGESHVTIDYDQGILYDFHGRGNSKPSSRYHRYIVDFLKNTRYPVNKLSSSGVHRYQDNFHLADLTDEQRRDVYASNPSLKYDIENENTWPEIIAAIRSGELDINNYTFLIALALMRLSEFDPEFIAKYNIDMPSLFNAFDSSEVVLPTEEAKKIFMKIYGERLINYMNTDEGFEELIPTTAKFKGILRRISMEFINVYQQFCPLIDKGFRKWESELADLLATPRLRKKILRCTDVVDFLNQYSDFSTFDSEGNALVRIDDESAEWGMVNSRNEFIVEPDYIALNYSPMDRDKLILIGKKRDGSFWKINLRTNETKQLAARG